MNQTGDHCLDFFVEEYTTGRVVFPPSANILEIGCAEADWRTPMLAERPDLDITGIDMRDSWGTRGDVLTHDFPPESFDAIVSISAIEHVGLGAYGDPHDEEGDTHAVQRAASWLKPGGVFYFDVPYRADGDYCNHGKHRAYNRAALVNRLIGPSGLTWQSHTVYAVGHPDSPYIACVLVKA